MRVYNGKLIKMDDLGENPPFSETSDIVILHVNSSEDFFHGFSLAGSFLRWVTFEVSLDKSLGNRPGVQPEMWRMFVVIFFEKVR